MCVEGISSPAGVGFVHVMHHSLLDDVDWVVGGQVEIPSNQFGYGRGHVGHIISGVGLAKYLNGSSFSPSCRAFLVSLRPCLTASSAEAPSCEHSRPVEEVVTLVGPFSC